MKLIAQSFQSLLLLVIVAMALSLGVPTYLAVSSVYHEQQIAERAQELDRLARSVSTLIAQNLKERSREIEHLAQSSLYIRAPLSDPELKASLSRVQKAYPLYSWIGIADPQGQVQVATGDMLVGQSVAERPWFQRAQTGMYVGDLHEAKLLAKLLQPTTAGQPIRFIDFAVPIRDENGEVRAILGSHVHWAWATELVSSVTPAEAQAKEIDIFLVNRNNEIIFPDTLGNEDTRLSAPPLPANQSASFLRWGDAEPYLTAVSAIEEPIAGSDLAWKVYVRQPKAQLLAQMRVIERVISWIFLGAALLFIVLAWWVGQRVGRPINELTRIAQNIAAGHPADFAVQAPTADLQRLSQSLRSMATTLLVRKQALEELNRDLEAKVAERTRELEQANLALRALSRQDPLTGLANRLAAHEWLSQEFNLLKRHHQPYAVLVIDIDHFKKVNDTHGHAAGDTVLRHVARLLRQSVRESDLVARMGGEEFMIVLPMTPLPEARKVAEKIRSTVEATPIEPVGQITLSIGVALARATDPDQEAAIRQADQLLYAAKHAGRNRVMTI